MPPRNSTTQSVAERANGVVHAAPVEGVAPQGVEGTIGLVALEDAFAPVHQVAPCAPHGAVG
eukprot:2319987-Lingulodinium_polyedra.AAC.1